MKTAIKGVLGEFKQYVRSLTLGDHSSHMTLQLRAKQHRLTPFNMKT